ncbi:transglutaminase-like domain-containing protein [Chamaesiphon sp. OTE_8_metabat_110]|uniref:SirB1 family protein n=1 Tax=Chamaesiphon sp. OTE_8_metabat_110 TaxID=2964696 RepID=UPI00286AA461|nr:transglutaminase-like domain-containing protein [Chamaesiphon sp. OTE_8_metabat_110]
MTKSLANFLTEIDRPDDREINLSKAALYIAQIEDPNLDVDRYLQALADMSADLAQRIPADRYPLKVIQVINEYLYTELGFYGNEADYYNPCNSFLNEVIDRRTGIPITLAIIYLHLAKAIDFPMVGIGMPGHFLIRPNFANAGIFVDVFDRGEILFVEDCRQKLMKIYQQDIPFLPPEILQPVSNRQILQRILHNLQANYLHQPDFNRALAIKHWLDKIEPAQ